MAITIFYQATSYELHEQQESYSLEAFLGKNNVTSTRNSLEREAEVKLSCSCKVFWLTFYQVVSSLNLGPHEVFLSMGQLCPDCDHSQEVVSGMDL